jgi:hypothetical protein
MPNISLRGLDQTTLLRIKSNARRRGISVNRLIVESLQKQYAAGDRPFDDLDALVGAWSAKDAAQFAAATAPFGEIDPGQWTARQLKADYRVKPAAKRKRAK